MNASESAGKPVATSAQTPVLVAAEPGTMRTSMYLPPLLPGVETGPQLPSALTRRRPRSPCGVPSCGAGRWRWGLPWCCRRWRSVRRSPADAAALPVVLLGEDQRREGDRARSARGEDADFQILKAFQSVLVKSRPVIHRALETQLNGKYVKDFTLVREQTDPVEWLQGIKTDFHGQGLPFEVIVQG